MLKWLRYIRLISWIILIWMMIVAVIEVRNFAGKLEKQWEADQVQRGFGILLRSMDDVARIIKKTEITIGNIDSAVKDFDKATKSLDKTINSLDKVAVDTNKNINENSIPRINQFVDNTSQSVNKVLDKASLFVETATIELSSTAQNTRELIVKIETVAEESRLSIEAMKVRVNDPKIDELMNNALETSHNLALASDNGNKTLENINQKTKQMLKPVHWAWTGLVVIGKILW